MLYCLVILVLLFAFLFYLIAGGGTLPAVTLARDISILHIRQDCHIKTNFNVFFYCCCYSFVYFLHLRRHRMHSMQTCRQRAIVVIWYNAEKRIPRRELLSAVGNRLQDLKVAVTVVFVLIYHCNAEHYTHIRIFHKTRPFEMIRHHTFAHTLNYSSLHSCNRVRSMSCSLTQGRHVSIQQNMIIKKLQYFKHRIVANMF